MNLDTASPESLLQHARWLRNLALQLARDESTAKDLVQETWAAALRAAPRPAEMRTWLARAVERFARHRRRSEHRRRQRERVAAAQLDDRSDADVDEAFEAQRALAELVQGLAQPYRTLVMRRYYDGWSAAEIARRTGVPAGTVRSQLARARTILRERWNASYAPESRRGMAGIALIAGIAPEALQGGIFMKSTHVGILAAACALALAFVWGSGVLTSPASAPRGGDAGGSALAGVAPEPEVARAEDAPEETPAANDREALAPESNTVAPVEEAPATRLVARVVDAAGRAIAGARLDAPEWAGFGSAESNEEGRLALVTAREKLQIWQGRAVPRLFRLSAAGHATHFLHAAMERDADTDLGDLVLAPGGVVVGRVVDERGAPVAGARVLVADAALGGQVDDARRSGPRSDVERVEAVSANDGSYRLAGVAAGAGRAWAHVAGRPWAFTPTIDVRAAAETAAPELVLVGPAPETLIAGVVLGPDGAPVAGAVLLTTGMAAGIIRYERATADDAGRFAVMAFDPGPHRVGAFHPEGALTATYAAQVMPGTDDLQLRLTELHWLEIQLVDDGDGRLLEEPWVHVEEDAGMSPGPSPPQAEREELGTGRLRVALPAGQFTISASARGYDYRSVGPFTREALPAVYELRLSRKPMVGGRVLAGGEPVAGARVQTMREISSLFAIETEGFQTRLFDGGAFATETDEEGRFEHPVSSSTPSGAHVVRASKAGWASAELTVEIDDDARGLELVLTPGGVVEGYVLLPPGSDPRGALVAASNGDGDVRTTRADAEGFYRLEHLRPGPWEVRFRAKEERFFMTQSAVPPSEPYQGDCVVVEGHTTRYDLDQRAKAIPVTGRLVIDGAAAAGWTARLEDTEALFSGDIAGSVVLDASGAFELVHDGEATRLVLETPETAADFVRIWRAIAPDPGGVQASLQIDRGRLSGTAPAGAQLRLTTPLADGWRHELLVGVGSEASFEVTVPAGRTTVEVETVEAGKSTRWVYATIADVAAGGAAAVEID